MPGVSIHLVPFLEIVVAVATAPLIGFFAWRGVRRRRRAARSTESNRAQ